MDIEEKSIVQSNPLINARKNMSVTEMRIFCLAVQDVSPHIRDDYDYDKEFPLTLIPTNTLSRLFKGHTGSVNHLKKSLQKAFAGHIELSIENGGFSLRHIYEKMEYKPEKGLYIQFHHIMRPYLLDLIGQGFTSIKMKEIWPLKSEYSWLLMQLLMEKKGYLDTLGKAFVPISIEDLRFKMNVPKNAYKGRLDNLRRKILDAPIREINETTLYKVWYETEKEGRRTIGFCIWITKKTAQEVEKRNEEQQEKEIREGLKNDTVYALVSAGVWAARAILLVKQYGEERCIKNLGFAKKNRTEDTKNFGAIVVSCIENDLAKGQNLFEEMYPEETEEEKEEKKEKVSRDAMEFDKQMKKQQLERLGIETEEEMSRIWKEEQKKHRRPDNN